MTELNIDASSMIVGRLASFVAKQALLGAHVRVFNCENLMITGTKRFLIPYYRHKIHGRTQAFKGPYISKMPDRFFRRVVKGMLPHKGSERSRGRVALSRVQCFLGIPVSFKNVTPTSVKECMPTSAASPLRELLRELGGTI